MKNLKKTDFQEISSDECQSINGGENALVYSAAALVYFLYRAALADDRSSSGV
jgi:hypothetical protein